MTSPHDRRFGAFDRPEFRDNLSSYHAQQVLTDSTAREESHAGPSRLQKFAKIKSKARGRVRQARKREKGLYIERRGGRGKGESRKGLRSA
jgi:hypothetical protein